VIAVREGEAMNRHIEIEDIVLGDVVVGVDGTPTALRAVRWAAAEARRRRSPLWILHAARYAAGADALARRRADDILARAFTVAHRAEPGVPTATLCSVDPPAVALLAASARAGLLVLGGSERVVGAPAIEVAGRASCPVVVTRGGPHPGGGALSVLVGVHDVDTDAAAVAFAFGDAQRHAGPVVVLHARHGAGALHDRLSGDEAAAAAVDREHLVEALRRWIARYPDVAVELEVLRGQPSAALLAAAAHARLVVVGSRARSGPARTLFGSTSRELLLRCPTPVAVLPSGVVVEDPDPSHDDLDHPHDLSRLY